MSLTSSLNLGRNSLLAQQTALETTGDNLANVATPGFKRRELKLEPARSQQLGPSVAIGRGVQVASVTRVVDEALEARLRGSISNEQGSAMSFDLLAQLEGVQNELTGRDTSTQLGEYFDAWSQLATNPQDPALREIVVSRGETLATHFNDTRGAYADLLRQTDLQLDNDVRAANDLLTAIGDLNRQISNAESGQPTAHTLRDSRDAALAELSAFLPISTHERDSGMVDVFVGSIPVVLDGQSLGLDVAEEPYDQLDGSLAPGDPLKPEESRRFIIVADDQTRLDLRAGSLAARSNFRNGALRDALNDLDELAGQVAFQTNIQHSQSQSLEGRATHTASQRIADATASLREPEAGLKPDFVPRHGGSDLHVSAPAADDATGPGIRSTTRIDVNLDGISPDTTLDDLAAQISAADGVTATVLPTGQLQIAADNPGATVSFSNDSSHALAALGLNSFLDGDHAGNLSVSAEIAGDPRLLAAARDHLDGDNRGALAIAELRTQPLAALQGTSLTARWSNAVTELGANVAAADARRQADGLVRENLSAQQAAVSGVNADEETIDLLQSQRAYQAAARYLTVVDEMLQTLLRI